MHVLICENIVPHMPGLCEVPPDAMVSKESTIKYLHSTDIINDRRREGGAKSRAGITW